MQKRHSRLSKSGLGFLALCSLTCSSLAAAQDEFDAESKAQELSRAVIGACGEDLKTYCKDVEPGEARIISCLSENRDSLAEPCRNYFDTWLVPELIREYRSAASFPSLEERELGEAVIDDEGEPLVWDRALPFMAQDVLDLGFDLPNPYGVALIPVWVRQDLILDNLAISINGGPPTEIDFVDFGTPSVENTTVQAKLDAWVFPFLNVYTTVGKLNGDANIPITIQGEDLLPELCSGIITPSLCDRTYSATARPSYTGETLTVGFNLAVGWKQFFATLPATYAWTDVDIIDTTVTAVNITPRVGITAEVGKEGLLAAFVGATYLDAEVDLAGQVSFETPGAPGGDITTIDFVIRQRNKDKWNMLVGFNWDLNRNWSIMAEAGVGGSRQNLITGVTYRW